MRRPNEFFSGDKPSASEFNRLFDELLRLTKVSAAPPLEVINNAGGVLIRFLEPEFYAMITDKDNMCSPIGYSWQEVRPNGDGTWQLITGGKAGSPGHNPAYHINNQDIAVGAIARLRPGGKEEYLFGEHYAPCNELVTGVACVNDELQVTKKKFQVGICPPGCGSSSSGSGGSGGNSSAMGG